MTILINILLVVYLGVCLFLLLAVLMQRPKSEGLGTAFGSGFTENILGAGATDFLVRFTSYVAVIFFCLALLLAYMYAHQYSALTPTQLNLLKAQKPAVSPAPVTQALPAAGTGEQLGAKTIPSPSSSVAPTTSTSPISSPSGNTSVAPALPASPGPTAQH